MKQQQLRMFFILPTLCNITDNKDDYVVSVPQDLMPLLKKYNALKFDLKKVNSNLAILLPQPSNG